MKAPAAQMASGSQRGSSRPREELGWEAVKPQPALGPARVNVHGGHSPPFSSNLDFSFPETEPVAPASLVILLEATSLFLLLTPHGH